MLQYLDKNTLLNSADISDIKTDSLISADSYNESKILNTFLQYNKDIQKLLLKCAIHIAIIGYGNRTYGAIRDDENNILGIEDIFIKYNINYNKSINEKYDDSSLSARRLVRLFRYQIQEFIIKENRPSYLWYKYSIKDNNKISICFPGAEHLITNKDDALYLLDCYLKLDNILSTNFVTRLVRVFIARGIFLPLDNILTKYINSLRT